MRVWVEWPGMRRFLGDVAPGGAATFQVPAEIRGTRGRLRLYADPTGSIDDVMSDPIEVGDGRRIEWRLRKVLANSRVRVM
ncbi:MAG TPA: hypothetical protein VLA36_10400 [Longimicrobiales bacterium]|nr:hypothetical protein [Longimicrobiales bacterium]